MCMALRVQPQQMLEQDGWALMQCIAAVALEVIYIGANRSTVQKLCTFTHSMCTASLDRSPLYITRACIRGHTIQQVSCLMKDPSV